MLTMHGDREHVVEAARYGVSDYVKKDGSAQTLLPKLEQILQKQVFGSGTSKT